MLTLDQFVEMVTALPEVTLGERYAMRTWFVGKKAFAWERPFSKADIKRYGNETPPDGPIVALITDGLVAKEAILASGLRGVFTIPHFDNYPAILVQLKTVTKKTMTNLLRDAWDVAKRG